MAIRNRVVILTDIEGDHIYGPYTETAADKAARRIERFYRKDDALSEGADWIVGITTIHQWNANDESEVS